MGRAQYVDVNLSVKTEQPQYNSRYVGIIIVSYNNHYCLYCLQGPNHTRRVCGGVLTTIITSGLKLILLV